MYCCPRCGDKLCDRQTELNAERPSYDAWEMDEQLRHIGRILRPADFTNEKADEMYRREAAEFDNLHAGPPAWHVSTAENVARHQKPRAETTAASGALIALALSLGSVAFVCGVTLLGWSMATGRQELWTIGLPVTLAGQVALMVGLVFQLDRLWRDNRDAAAKLDSVDEQLRDLKTTTTLLGTSHGANSGVFYSHFAGGAGPQLLLTDLKSQLDLLAIKIAQNDR
jgi:hypothetical protein